MATCQEVVWQMAHNSLQYSCCNKILALGKKVEEYNLSQYQTLNCSSTNQTVIPIVITLVAKQKNNALLYAVAQEMMVVEERIDVNITIEAVQRFGNYSGIPI